MALNSFETKETDESRPLLPDTVDTKHASSTISVDIDRPLENAIDKQLKTERLGYLMMFAGACTFSVHALLVRLAESTYSVPSIMSLYVRGVIHVILSSIYFLVAYKPSELFTWTLSRRQTILLFFRGLSGTVSLLTFYAGVRYIYVADSLSVFFLNPMFTLILARIFLNEPISAQGITAVILSIMGTLLIGYDNQQTQTETQHHETPRIVGIVLSIIGAFLAAVAYTTIRALGMSISFMSSVFTFGSFCFVASIILNSFTFFPHAQLAALSAYGVGTAAAAGLASFIAQCFLNLGLQRCKAGPGVLLTNIEIPIVFTLAAIFLHEIPGFCAICGSVLILSSALVIGLGKISRRK